MNDKIKSNLTSKLGEIEKHKLENARVTSPCNAGKTKQKSKEHPTMCCSHMNRLASSLWSYCFFSSVVFCVLLAADAVLSAAGCVICVDGVAVVGDGDASSFDSGSSIPPEASDRLSRENSSIWQRSFSKASLVAWSPVLQPSSSSGSSSPAGTASGLGRSDRQLSEEHSSPPCC